MSRPSVIAACLATGILAVSGCSSSDSSTPGAGSGPTGAGGSPSGTATAGGSRGVVQGVALTADGSALHFGDVARVSWSPDRKTTGVIRVTVTKVDRVPLSAFRAWRLTGTVLRSTPYYVHARVRNLGTSKLSGVPVPLYLLDQRNVLLQASTFRARFDACPSTPFPARFTHGRTTSVCLVYFAPRHGKMAAVSFRPTQDVDGITWRGHVTVVRTGKHATRSQG